MHQTELSTPTNMVRTLREKGGGWPPLEGKNAPIRVRRPHFLEKEKPYLSPGVEEAKLAEVLCL